MMLRPSYLDLINVVNKEAEPGKELEQVWKERTVH